MPLKNKITIIVKKHWGHLLALLTHSLKDLDLAEDSLQEALESALKHWQKNGIPQNPHAWLFTTAKHKALDRIRRTNNFQNKKDEYQRLLNLNESVKEDDFSIPDERLRLIFTCCHPVLAELTSVALTLRLLGGLTTAEIASAYLINTPTMAQRIVRGKRKIKKANIPYVIPEKDDFQRRLATVLRVIYLIFNEGYSASNSQKLIRHTFCFEAIRLGKILFKLCPQDAEVKGLLSLMLLHDSRTKARYNNQGNFISLENQDRMLWNKGQIKQGIILLHSALKQKHTGSYQIQAAISALHCEASSFKETDWHQIVLLYDELLKTNPSPIVKLNQLMAQSHLVSVQQVLNQLDDIEDELINYHPFYVVKAELLVKARRYEEAKVNFHKAITNCHNSSIKKYLAIQLGRLGG